MNPKLEAFAHCMQVLEDNFSRIHNAVELMWGTQECIKYLNNLILDSRDGTRKGFTREVASAILQLIWLHTEAFPEGKDEGINEGYNAGFNDWSK